jgi:hypothetical protein
LRKQGILEEIDHFEKPDQVSTGFSILRSVPKVQARFAAVNTCVTGSVERVSCATTVIVARYSKAKALMKVSAYRFYLEIQVIFFLRKNRVKIQESGF